MSSPEPDRAAGAGARPSVDAGRVVRDLRQSFDSGRSRPLAHRRRQLAGLIELLRRREDAILDALAADLGRPRLESYVADVAHARLEAEHALKHLAEWMRPRRVPSPAAVLPAKSEVLKEPLGVVLILAPWNYPVQLTVGPLIGAVAAGNCAVVKPSELAPHVSSLLAEELPRFLDPECVRVVEGGVEETTSLLAEAWDHIFFTGGGRVGRIVMEAAAKHLTPVTLELGGKCPCIVDRTADIEVAARRIVWGKFWNAGQTCIAPDYVLVDEAVHDPLVHRLASTVRSFYGDDPQKSADYGRIVDRRHAARLAGLLGEGQVAIGGTADVEARYVAPTVLRDVPPDAKVMQEEIFGPILPVLTVPHVEAAIAFVNRRPKPLALYCFSSDRKVQRRVLERTSSGAVTLNHVWLHAGVPELPFGGVGPSGMGAYHGKASFDLFSHDKAVLHKPTSPDPSILYPPYGRLAAALIRKLL